MGLIKAGFGSVGGVLADQWKEFFTCDSLTENVLAVRGHKKVTGRSSNTKGDDNVITKGSVVAVADGQCMIIVDQGKIVEFCAEPGEFVYDSSSEPSLFSGSLGTAILDTFKNIGKRFTFGGEAPKDQRVYYLNTKELIGNKYGTANPVPFHIVDKNIGLELDINVRCCGEYSYRVTNPLLFFTNVCGNVEGEYTRDRLEGQLKTELLTALQPAFHKISQLGVRYSDIPGHTMELADALNEVLSAKWRDLRGLEIVSFGVSSVRALEEDEKMIKELQRNAVFRNPNMAAAQLVGAQSEAMVAAANNPNNSAMAFMGMGMAGAAGGMNAQSLYQMGGQPVPPQPTQPQAAAPAAAAPAAAAAAAAAAATWDCACGHKGNTGKFCMECGKPKPAPAPAADGWTCSCGVVNKGKFCMECGKPKPAAALLYKCDKCGWEPADPAHPPKFCPECGDVFNDSDIQK